MPQQKGCSDDNEGTAGGHGQSKGTRSFRSLAGGAGAGTRKRQGRMGDFSETEPQILGTSGIQGLHCSHGDSEASARATGEGHVPQDELPAVHWDYSWPVHPLLK